MAKGVENKILIFYYNKNMIKLVYHFNSSNLSKDEYEIFLFFNSNWREHEFSTLNFDKHIDTELKCESLLI